jgi:hypothetical protein
MLLQLPSSLRNGDTALHQHRPQLVDQGGSFADKPITDTMQRLHVELVGALQLDEAHGRPGGGFGDRFGVPVVVLLRLDVWADIFRRHQPDLMPVATQDTPQMVRAAAGFHRHHTGRQGPRRT